MVVNKCGGLERPKKWKDKKEKIQHCKKTKIIQHWSGGSVPPPFWETVLISCSLLKVVMFFPDKLVCFRKYKNKQAWLMTRVKASEGQNTGRKSVICLTLALTQKVIRLQEVLGGMTGQSICKNNNNGDDNVATEKNGTKPYFLFIWCPSRRWSHFNSSTTKVLQLSHFPSVKLHLSIMMNFIWKPKGIPSPYV